MKTFNVPVGRHQEEFAFLHFRQFSLKFFWLHFPSGKRSFSLLFLFLCNRKSLYLTSSFYTCMYGPFLKLIYRHVFRLLLLYLKFTWIKMSWCIQKCFFMFPCTSKKIDFTTSIVCLN